ncbi:MAG TPA: EAL domain-containing protein [Alphaproteobacteria bacterium]|jgi:diguanylate cyclase (GGDEF)-like protein|nr:EAL domain-containing protein [Alphaproteobacteria bacterium]
MTFGQPAWKSGLLIGGTAVAGYFALPGVLPKDVGYEVIGLASVAAIVVGTCRNRPAQRAPWLLLATANLFFVFGDSVAMIYDFLGREAPFPSIGDALYLSGYPFLAAGVWGIVHAAGHSGSRENRADAAIVSVGALALSWHFLMGSYAHDQTLSALGRLVTMAYPVMDIGLLFLVVNSLVFGRDRRVAAKLIAASMGAMVVADFVYDIQILHGSYAVGNLIDAGWLISYVLLGAAALHPSMASSPAPVSDGTQRRRWMPVVALAGFVSPVIMFVSALMHESVDVRILAATSIVLFALVVVRVSWLFTRLANQSGQLQKHADSLQEALATQRGLEGDLRHQAFHDSLTGLANRELLRDRVEHALAASRRSPGTVALIFCDLDGFKTVNDSLGHGCGDELLIAASKRLLSVVRSGDTVARLGGDEFAILMDNVHDAAIATTLAERVVSVLREPVELARKSISVSASVGIAFADGGQSLELLLSEADAAMYAAKSGGKNRFEVFQTEMRARVVERLELTNALRGAMERSEFYLQYQPYFSMHDGRLQGFEALARWHHPTKGEVGPAEFIPIAEETGLILPLGRWVLETACAEAATWPLHEGRAPTVSVNISGRQLHDRSLVDDVRTALAFSAIPAQQLILEVTESRLMDDPTNTAAILTTLKSMGIRLAIDDFGTGYSSLSYLRQFPIDVLKIDKSFVDPLADPSSEVTAFVKTIIRLARDLHLSTVAEGIEDRQQYQTLSDLGCDSAQGYFTSRPLNAGRARRLAGSAALAGTVN